jgi:hypothetical protein
MLSFREWSPLGDWFLCGSAALYLSVCELGSRVVESDGSSAELMFTGSIRGVLKLHILNISWASLAYQKFGCKCAVFLGCIKNDTNSFRLISSQGRRL